MMIQAPVNARRLLFLPDLSGRQSMCGGLRRADMNAGIASTVIQALVKEMRARLETASSVAKAGHTCAQAGSPERAIDIVIELGDDLHQAKRLFDATLAVSQRSKA